MIRRRSLTDKFLVYALKDPRNGAIRYVGKSTSGLNRPREHQKPSERQPYLRNWVLKLLQEGVTPEIVVIERFFGPEKLSEAEIYWIRALRASGCNLVNLTNGGEGRLGLRHTEEAKQRISKANTGIGNGMYGRRHTQEALERIRQASIGRRLSPESREKVSRAKKGVVTSKGWQQSPEAKKKISEAMKGNKRNLGNELSEETRDKIRKALTGLRRSTETRRRISEAKRQNYSKTSI